MSETKNVKWVYQNEFCLTTYFEGGGRNTKCFKDEKREILTHSSFVLENSLILEGESINIVILE